jgi:uncharacterized protein YaeQ
MDLDARREAIMEVLREVYTERGAKIWWKSRNKSLGGLSAEQVWETGDELLIQRVEAQAARLVDGGYV